LASTPSATYRAAGDSAANEARVEAALKPSQASMPAAPPTVSLAAPSHPGALEPTKPAQARVRPTATPEAAAAAAESSKRRVSRRSQQQQARADARPTAEPARTAAPREPGPDVDDREFPGLFRKQLGAREDQRSRAADDDSSLGANASPLLD
jgi:hypothetical protein